MADEDADSKTEDPSSRKLDKAREEGDISQSPEVKTAVALVSILVVIWMLIPSMMSSLKVVLAGLLAHSATLRVGDEANLFSLMSDVAMRVAVVMVAPLGLILVIGIASSAAQTGLMFTPSKIMPDLNKINPLSGLGRMFSVRSLVELLKSVTKLAVVGTVCLVIMMPRLKELQLLISMELAPVLDYLHSLVIRLLFTVALMVIVIGAADWFYQRFTFHKKLRMTKQEVKDEHKQTEGDPMVKSRLRSLRMQRARQRMMAAVPKADVVVTNPTHYACALKYDGKTMKAPVLVAKGRDLVALRIRDVAEKNKVPVVENPPLARALYATVEIDREIPPEHYKAVAEVISYVMRLKGGLRR
jgi:flagellar biosynthetic protein FlhB